MSRLKDLFNAAMELEPRERAAFLDRECISDPDLRRRIDLLLRAHDDPDSNVVGPLAAGRTGTFALDDHATGTFGNSNVTSDHEPQADVGTVIAGKYKLIEMIGEGGMGSVWMAQQTEPVKRAVAIKLIKAGMDSKAVLARFDAERQALAVMDHPNIARVLDGGATPDGRPFFVMELVKGVPITQFCDERKLTPHQRLELFIPVCQAIQHAHQKGVIHRDIKPNNVLVALYDDKPVPKVIDFGVAKATGATLTDHTLMTGFGAVVGTPEYMSPEQASLNNLDIDTRSDVYSLGVLLYELLTGTTPVDRKSLGKAVILEVLRIVREVEAPRPSAKLSSSGTLPSVAANRSMDPAKLSWLLKRDLDWIVLKSLEKDRARRYESANGLAADVQRYLAGEAVQAHPPSRAYRLRKFARKNRVALATAAVFTAMLMAGAVLGSWLAVKATRAENRAEAKRIEAEGNAKEAQKHAAVSQELALKNEVARVEAETTATSLQVDLDLSELHTDPRVGLLRLARPRNKIPLGKLVVTDEEGNSLTDFVTGIDFQERNKTLREFLTAAVLAIGQAYAPLLPPITQGGQRMTASQISPDGKRIFTLGLDGAARLWDTRTAKSVGCLRHGNERIVNGGFSSDGKTVFTDDETGVARFWEPAEGKYRAATQRRLDLYKKAVDLRDSPGVHEFGTDDNPIRASRSDCMIIGRDRLISQKVVARARPDNPKYIDNYFAGPVDLWDTITGRHIARLDKPGSEFTQHEFTDDGKWIKTVVGKTIAVIYSADDGAETVRLSLPAGELVRHIAISPTSRRIAVASELERRDHFSGRVRVWDRESAKWQDGVLSFDFNNPKHQGIASCYFLAGEHLAVGWHDGGWTAGTSVYRPGDATPIAVYEGDQLITVNRQQNAAHASGDTVFNFQNGKRLTPPAGHRFHPSIRDFAIDGRFVRTNLLQGSTGQLIDSVAGKHLPTPGNWRDSTFLPGFALIHTSSYGNGIVIRLIPSSIPNIAPPMLELWAQVAVRGELDPNGEFVKWNESTWEKKRQQLAAIPPPHPDLPFPGYVATDKLHWLRAEFNEAKTDADKLRLARELFRRAEAVGDRNEAARWRVELERRTTVVAPPPREVKP